MPSGGARLRVLAGPQDDLFEPDALTRLEHARFTVTPQSNRMGYRLAGGERSFRRTDDGEMISDATFTGAVQIPPSGDPILLLSDRQTTGGYPQIATVITADLPVAAQLAPGDWVEFQLCTRADALAALEAQEASLDAVD
jgi:antagonist of KipI